MCDTCGCGQPEDTITIRKPVEEDGAEHHHHQSHHNHHTDQDHNHQHSHGRKISVEQDVLKANNLLAERNRGYFDAKCIFALNLVSSPGSGKTTILEKSITELKDEFNIAVIEGDQQTMRDADRIKNSGASVVQINTGAGCHLDANMVQRAMKELQVKANSMLFIENVGNLVCPALFDLGEALKVLIVSVTEGDDKPLKYPHMFNASGLCLINKTDLLPYVDFDVNRFKEYALRVNHHLTFFDISAKTCSGMEDWYGWLREGIASANENIS